VAQCDADLRPGGEHRYVLAREGAVVCAFYGKYREIVRPTRLVYTQIFEPFPDAEVVVTVSFEERDGSTTVVAHEHYPTKEALEAAMSSGMEEGLRETYDLLDELVVSLRG
jgi:uncharacterized protein YndB with AHSA1/START domain